MSFCVTTLPRAEADVRAIARYVQERSPSGATAWLTALEQAINHLEEFADGCGEAAESGQFEIEVRQALFKTRRSRVYRLLFTIVDDEVSILRVRGPGQGPLIPKKCDQHRITYAAATKSISPASVPQSQCGWCRSGRAFVSCR